MIVRNISYTQDRDGCGDPTVVSYDRREELVLVGTDHETLSAFGLDEAEELADILLRVVREARGESA